MILILVTFHQDPSLCVGFSSRPIWNSIQIGRHIKYKGLCKLTSLTTILQWKGILLHLYIILNWIFLFNVTARLKICPHISKSSLLFFFLKYKNQRNFFCSIVEKATALCSLLYVCVTKKSATGSISENLHRNVNPHIDHAPGTADPHAGVLPLSNSSQIF